MTTLASDTASTDTAYTDATTDAAGATYAYAVIALRGEEESQQSNEVELEVPSASERGLIPGNLTGRATYGIVYAQLLWSRPKIDFESVTGYEILRGPSADALTTLVSDTGRPRADHYADQTANVEGQTYFYRIKAIRGEGRSEASNLVEIKIPHSGPSNLTARILDEGGVALAWDAPERSSGSVTGYRIYREQDGAGLTTLVADTGSADSAYTDATATVGSATYRYLVSALSDGLETKKSDDVEVTLPRMTAAARALAPGGLTGKVDYDDLSVALEWNSPQNDAESVTGYEILRGPSADALTTLVDDTGSGQGAYTDRTASVVGDTYFYRVRAIRGKEQSETSPLLEIKILRPRPTNVTAVALDEGGVALAWHPPATDAESVSGYEILRGQGDAEPTTLVADNGTPRVYQDVTANQSGETYTYEIKAIRDGERSAPSNRVSVEILWPPVGGVEANLSPGDGVWLTWDDPGDDRVTGYRILRGKGSALPTVQVEDTGSADAFYYDGAATELGAIYVYRVVALRGQQESLVSDEAGVFILPAGPTNLVAERVFQDDGVTPAGFSLGWVAPAQEAGSITGYRILRGPRASELSALVEDTGSTDTTYTDATAILPSGYYQYRVLALRGDEEGRPSRPAIFTEHRSDPEPVILPDTDGGNAGIDGTVRVGQTLTANTSDISDDDGLTNVSYSHQWISSDGTTDVEIDGATDSTYLLTPAEQGRFIKLRVSFTDDDNAESRIRDGTTDVEIDGATDSTYLLTPAEQGRFVKSRVSITDDDKDNADKDNAESRTSDHTRRVAPEGFDLSGYNPRPSGIWGNADTIWVANDDIAPDNKIFAYNRSTGNRDASRDFNTLEDNHNHNPRGLWPDRLFMYVLDEEDRRVYAYRRTDDPITSADETGDPHVSRNIGLVDNNNKAQGI